MSAVYLINKGVNRTLEFKGIKGSYILYLGTGLVLLFVLSAILFTAGLNNYLLLGIILPAGAILFLLVARLSKRYGEHGLLKKIAKQQLPQCVASKNSKTFFLSGK
jgi:cell division protein FtsW (lipid II flippase)